MPIFVDDRDRRTYLWILGDVAAEFGWIRLGHCLMTNHIHLLLETPEPNLSQGMQRLQLRYTKRFNKRHERRGHLFGERFGSNRITSDEQLITATRYVTANPVEAGLCQTGDAWPWTNCEAAKRRVSKL
jgi:putative transposase